MKKYMVIGGSSYIYQGIKPMMEADGWSLCGPNEQWDMLLITMGRVAPAGHC